MRNIKRIIISAGISLVILIICNMLLGVKDRKSYIEVPIAINSIIKGKAINEEDVIWIKIKESKETKEIYEKERQINFGDSIAKNNIESGQIITTENIVLKSEYLKSEDNMSYVAIPVSNTTEAVGYKIEKGDNITVYYTAKRRLVSEILKDKIRIYGANVDEALVTCKLLENVEIVSVNNSTGEEGDKSSITDVVVRTEDSNAMLIANLKEQGVFYIALN